MRRLRNWSLLVVALASTGCATSSHRVTRDSLGSRSGPWSKTAAPAQTQVELPPEQPDVFMAAMATNQSRLTRYFPGLARKPVASPVMSKSLAHTRTPSGPVAEKVVEVAAAPTRPSFFSFLKPTAPRTYSTDTQTLAARSRVEPSILPVALQLPIAHVADRAVTPTSAEVSDGGKSESDQETQSKPTSTRQPESDPATAPLSTTEPVLAVDPITAPAPAPRPSESLPTPEVPSPEPPTPEAPAPDPRERPRLSSNPADVPGPTSDQEQPDSPPAATVATASPMEPKAETAAVNETKAVQAAPSVADPGQSLGLPSPTLPASYSEHSSIAARGSYQAPQPPPVMASPQVEASPQSGGSTHSHASTVTSAWQRPSLSRLVRRMKGTGEFATTSDTLTR